VRRSVHEIMSPSPGAIRTIRAAPCSRKRARPRSSERRGSAGLLYCWDSMRSRRMGKRERRDDHNCFGERQYHTGIIITQCPLDSPDPASQQALEFWWSAIWLSWWSAMGYQETFSITNSHQFEGLLPGVKQSLRCSTLKVVWVSLAELHDCPVSGSEIKMLSISYGSFPISGRRLSNLVQAPCLNWLPAFDPLYSVPMKTQRSIAFATTSAKRLWL